MKTRNSNPMTREEIIASIQDYRDTLAHLEDMYKGYLAAGSKEVNFEEATEEIEEVREIIKNLMKDLSEKVEYKGTLPVEISIDGRHMFLDREDIEGSTAYLYQAADSFCPDIYVSAANEAGKKYQPAERLMELELISRGIQW